MSETHLFVIVICLACLGFTVHACVPYKSHSSKCQSFSKGRNQKSSCSQQNQLNVNAAENAISSTKIHYPSPNRPVSSGVPISNPNANGAPRVYYPVPQTMDGSIGVYTKPYGCFRKVRSMGKNQFDRKLKDEITPLLPHDIDLRDDVIKSRIRRNGDDATLPIATHRSTDPDTTSTWQDLVNFFLSKRSSDVTDDHDEDDNSWRGSQETDNSKDSQHGTLESVESSGSSIEFFERFRERMPRLYQRLQALRELITDSSSDERAQYADISNPFDAETYADFDHRSNATEMTGQPKNPDETTLNDSTLTASSRDKSMAASMNHGNVENPSTFTTMARQDHEITTANSY